MDTLKPNITLSVPFFMVLDMETSLKFYIDGLGFQIKNQWVPCGKIEWCWLERDKAAIMLQEYRKAAQRDFFSNNPVGFGVSICFMCEDALALYHEFIAKGVTVSEPFVGNGLWDVALKDPDGYNLHFESATDVPEETKYSDWQGSK